MVPDLVSVGEEGCICDELGTYSYIPSYYRTYIIVKTHAQIVTNWLNKVIFFNFF